MHQRNRHHLRGPLSALLSAVVVAGASAGWASAANKPPKPGGSAVSQYVEMLPTGSGSVAAGLKVSAPAVLQPAARKALRSLGRGAAAALATVATSSAYAAPASTTRPRPKPDGGRPRQQSEPSVAVALSSVAGTARIRDGRRVVALFILFLLTTAALLAARVLRPRATSR